MDNENGLLKGMINSNCNKIFVVILTSQFARLRLHFFCSQRFVEFSAWKSLGEHDNNFVKVWGCVFGAFDCNYVFSMKITFLIIAIT